MGQSTSRNALTLRLQGAIASKALERGNPQQEFAW